MSQSVSRPLGGLLIAQFFGAFNDNAWKMITAFLAIKAATGGLPPGDPSFEQISQSQTTLTFVIFTLPLALISLPSGVLADRVSKRTIIIALKAVEIVLMLAGTLALAFSASVWPCLFVLALMGVQSALFSPAKYGILPELLPQEELSAGNGVLEMWTFFAIILGTGAGGFLLDVSGGSRWVAGFILTVFATIGFLASFWIPPTGAARSEGGFVETVTGSWTAIRSDRVVWLAVLGSVFFWTTASLLGQDILVYAKQLTKDWAGSDTYAGLPMGFFGVGTGIGSIMAGRISGHRVEYGLIPLGAIGIAFFSLLLGGLGPGYLMTLVFMTFLGISSGYVVVPLGAILQWRSPADKRGGVIALANVMVFGGIMVGSLAAGFLSGIGLTSRMILVLSSVMTVGGTIWAIHLLPDFLIRLVFVLLTHLFYRLKVVGRENIPQEGGALIVPNHVSLIDSFLVMASIDRPVRFIVDEIYYRMPVLNWLMRAMRAIPVSATGGLRVVLKALREAGNTLDEGDLVCIFAEGQMTRIGIMLPFRRGLERIVKGRTAPILPINLDRIWGSLYTRAKGTFFFKWPERWFFPVTVTIGKPVPSSTTAFEVRRIVQQLGYEAWSDRRDEARPLHHSFVRRMRNGIWKFAIGDEKRPRISRIQALISVISLARALRGPWKDQENVGILLPPSIGGAMANVAASLSGKTSVNLNFTAGKAGMGFAAKHSGIKTVITNREFLEKAKVELPEGISPIFLEDVVAGISFGEKAMAALLAVTAPIRWLEKACGATRETTIDDIATIIFSSGSTGDPKGVMLTHFNVDSNCEGVGQALQVGSGDRLMGVLPLFHSFGYMSLWFSLKFGMGVVCHANPLEAAKIGDLVERFSVTFLIATPTFLQIYLRRCGPGQFGSLRIVLTGAEKLNDRLSVAFEEKFGIRPIEGYGATECSPAIAVSTLDFRTTGIYQPGSKRGSVGHPVPGVAVSIVDPETGELLLPGKPGMLRVKGPNVMKGYLGRDDLTAKAIQDGWYITGDIAIQDEDGFLKITDRLSRFSKIGGEMIPHGKVEEALQEAAGADIQVFAVTAVPDERKGEALVVLHTLDESRLPEIMDKFGKMGLPNLFTPKKDNFLKVEKIPILGTGKVDLRMLKKIALEKFGPPPKN